MKITVFFLLLFLNSMSILYAEESARERFFIYCDSTFRLKEFSTLKNFFNKHPSQVKPSKCFRLNNSEFLVIITDTGRIEQGLYFVDTKKEVMNMENGYALIDIEKEFFGKNKKRYVLLKESNLERGYYSYGYSILTLIPKTNKKSYNIYSLFSVVEDPVDGLCGEERERFIKEGKKAETVKSYKILNEYTEDVTLIFYIVEEDCKALKKRTYTKKFKLINGIFKLVTSSY